MTTISDKLTSIYNAKKDIKSAIIQKGQSVGDNILDYAAAIQNIEQGSGGSSTYRNWWKVYFIDYDGTVLSYQEVNNGADFVFPDAPDHTDKFIRFTGWNQTSNHTTDYDPKDLYTIVIGALYDVIDKPDTVENTKLMFNAHSITMTVGLTLTSTVANGITVDWGDGSTTTSSSTDKTEYTHTYDRSYLCKDVTVEIQCADGNTYSFDGVKTGLDNILPTNVKLGKGVTSIGESAFQNCYNMQSVAIPSSVTSIGGQAFDNCYSLQSVSIPSSVTSIGDYAFSSCYSLQSVSIPSSVTSIGESVFNSCRILQSVTIPSGVTSIGNNAFNGCSLQSVTIPSSVTSIGDSAFGNCYCIQSVSIPESVTSIGNYVFDCYSIIYNNAVCNRYNANSIYNAVELEADKVIGTFIKSVTIPSGVTSTGYRAFFQSYSLQSVTIPESVTSIGEGTFEQCYSLQSVNIPSGVTSIGESALTQCYSLKSLNIPESVTSIGDSAFVSCYNIKSVAIPSGITSISNSMLSQCYSLKSITIPESVTSIGNSAFNSCRLLQSISIPSGVTSISNGTFSYCYSLKSVNIPSSVTFIDYYAFNECSSLQSVIIPSGVEKINMSTFNNCCNLQSVTIPSSVTTLDYNAFQYCYSLKYVNIPSSVTSFGYRTFYDTNCVLDFGNERNTVPSLSSTWSLGYNFCIVPDALYDTWCAATNWSTMTDRIIKYSDYHK